MSDQGRQTADDLTYMKKLEKRKKPQNHKYRKQTGGCLGLGRGLEGLVCGGVTVKGYGPSTWGEENILS